MPSEILPDQQEESARYQNATIVWEGAVGGRDDDRPKTVYRMELGGTQQWFLGEEQYEGNSNDFRIVISRFGCTDKLSTKASDARLRRKFDASEAEAIQRRLVEFFMGSERKAFFPFTHPKACCLGVIFSKEWITIVPAVLH
jgi:hypothetical protein